MNGESEGDREGAGVVVFGTSGQEGCGLIEVPGVPSVEYVDFALALSTDPDGHGVGCRTAEDRTVGDTDNRGLAILGD